MNDNELMDSFDMSATVLDHGVIEVSVGCEQIYLNPQEARQIASILIEKADAGDDRKRGKA